MTHWIRKLHIYAGLLVFAHLALYGMAGLIATFQTGPERPKVPHTTEFVPFEVPRSATDKEVARAVYRALRFPMTHPVPDWFLRRTPDNHLLLDFYNINGIYRVVVLEDEKRLRIEHIRNSTWLFLEDIHAATAWDRSTPGLLRLWGIWNETAMLALLGFCISGAWLWLATRPRYAPALASLAFGVVSLLVLWSALR